MTPTKKKQMRRYVAQAYQHQMRTVEILVHLGEMFGEFHKDYQNLFVLIANTCSVTMALIRQISILAWGYFPDDFMKWLQ